MTEQKSTQLSPEEWKQLCVLNVQQLLNFLNAIPAQGQASEQDTTIIPGLTQERMLQIEAHLERGGQFLRAWSRSRPVGVVEAKAKPETEAAPAPKRKGGWPAGKPRKPRAVEAQAQH